MTKKQVPSPKPTRSADSTAKQSPLEAFQPKKANGTRRPPPTPEMVYEPVALNGPEYHVQHWGINE